jgi:hypothetical protein
VNVIFATQGEIALFYLDLLPLLGQKISLEQIGFYVTHLSNYPRYSSNAESLGLKIKFMKEWEITNAVNESPDIPFLESIEKQFGEPFLYNVLLADRRIFNGVLTKCKQDYKPRFSQSQMLSLLQKGFTAIRQFIDDIKPNLIIGGFTPVTFGEYILYLCAKAEGIKYINLNPTKILNYVTFSEEIYREFPHVEKTYKEYLSKDEKDDFLEEARRYLEKKDGKYEGVVISSPGFPYMKWGADILKWPLVTTGYYLKRAYLDNQVRGYHWRYFFNNIYNPLKDKAVQRFLPYFAPEKLNQVKFAYYPLHVEPEIALSLFGREYLNQIELVRNIAKSIPVTWKLVVKDHPAGVGRRNIRYYKKLLEIPNVVLVNHYVNSKAVIENAKIVFTVSGFSGFEAILEKKPVITFGRTFYNIMPDCMVSHVQSLQDLPHTVSELLENYRYSEKDVVCLIAAIIKNSIPLNLYEKVLKKKERITVEEKKYSDQKREFVNFMLKWIN